MKGEDAAGGKQSKEGLTAGLCASVTGEKIKPLVIGKSCQRSADWDLPATGRVHHRVQLVLVTIMTVSLWSHKHHHHLTEHNNAYKS